MAFIKKISKITVLLTLLFLFTVDGSAQESKEQPQYRKFPIIIGLQAQNFSMPLRDIGSHFSHPGLFAGTEIAYNKKGSLFQSAAIGGYLNKEMGDGVYGYTQFGYRPRITKNLYAEAKVGVGYLHVFHPVPAYQYQDSEWQQNSGGKSQLIVPIDLGVEYNFNTSFGLMSPFFSYQINPALFYNSTLPLNIYTNFLLGCKLKLFK